MKPQDNKEVGEIINKDDLQLLKLSGGKLTTDGTITDVECSDALLFRDQYNHTYIAFNGDGSDVSPVHSPISKMWINNRSFNQYRKVLSKSAMQQVLDTLAAKAHFEGEQYKLSVRHAWLKEELWYDLGGSAAQITKTGWVVTKSPPIIFVRFPHQTQQVMPIAGGSIGLLLKYVNLDDPQEQLLFIVYVVAAFIPGFARPLLILSGPQGAGKTTPMKVAKAVIDPSELSGASVPVNETAFVQAASHESFLFYDNISVMPSWFSDVLSKASTGYAFSKRELFSNDTDVFYFLQKAIALNGISQVISRADLLDRSILLSLERITPDKRKSEDEFWGEFDTDRPAILGAILDVLAKALKIHPQVRPPELPRMATFARWGYAIAEAAGYGGQAFIDAYNENIDLQQDEAIDANPVATAIVEFMKDRNDWRGRASELYGFLQTIVINLHLASKSGWPANAAILGRELRRIIPSLAARGIVVTIPKRGNQRTLELHKTTDVTDSTDSK
jgi:hypothetical protein